MDKESKAYIYRTARIRYSIGQGFAYQDHKHEYVFDAEKDTVTVKTYPVKKEDSFSFERKADSSVVYQCEEGSVPKLAGRLHRLINKSVMASMITDMPDTSLTLDLPALPLKIVTDGTISDGNKDAMDILDAFIDKNVLPENAKKKRKSMADVKPMAIWD